MNDRNTMTVGHSSEPKKILLPRLHPRLLPAMLEHLPHCDKVNPDAMKSIAAGLYGLNPDTFQLELTCEQIVALAEHMLWCDRIGYGYWDDLSVVTWEAMDSCSDPDLQERVEALHEALREAGRRGQHQVP